MRMMQQQLLSLPMRYLLLILLDLTYTYCLKLPQSNLLAILGDMSASIVRCCCQAHERKHLECFSSGHFELPLNIGHLYL